MLPVLDFAGEARVLACLPGPALCGFPRFSDHFEEVAPDQLIDVDLGYNLPILNQGRTSACTGYATSKAIATSHALRSGGELVKLAPGYVYSKANGGRDQGAMIATVLQVAQRYGCCPYDDFPEPAIYPQQGKPAADRDALAYRVEEAYLLTSPQQCLSAIVHGMPVVAGWALGSNFARVDGEGLSPKPTDMIGGHALPGTRVFYSKRQGLWCLGGDNSWGPTFGVQGRYAFPIQWYGNGQFQAFALKGLVADANVDGPRVRKAA